MKNALPSASSEDDIKVLYPLYSDIFNAHVLPSSEFIGGFA
jgi:hypothetical protein